MQVVVGVSESYSNIAVAHFTGGWGFTSDIKATVGVPGDLITLYCSEKESRDVQGLHGLGVICGPQVSGIVEDQRWLDEDYYGLIPFRSLSNKFMNIKELQNRYNTNKSWNNSVFNIMGGALKPVQFTQQQLREFLLFMLA